MNGIWFALFVMFIMGCGGLAIYWANQDHQAEEPCGEICHVRVLGPPTTTADHRVRETAMAVRLERAAQGVTHV